MASRAGTSTHAARPGAIDARNARLIRDLIDEGTLEDPRVIEAMESVTRHLFVPPALRDQAYENRPVPIGYGQTISQPTIVAMMTQALELTPESRVLEIGSGCGYQTAILSRLCKEVFSIEVIKPLAQEAKHRLAGLGYNNAHVRAGDGYAGWPEHAPFDRIIMTAAPPEMPQALLDQLGDPGILIGPIGELWDTQSLVRVRKDGGHVTAETLTLVRFVPMVRGDASQ